MRFAGRLRRALAWGAEYLVLHPGSWKGLTRDEGLRLAAESITKAIDGLAWQGTPFSILIENTAGADFRWVEALNRWRNWWRG
jgi:deoxyribonuclease-4